MVIINLDLTFFDGLYFTGGEKITDIVFLGVVAAGVFFVAAVHDEGVAIVV